MRAGLAAMAIAAAAVVALAGGEAWAQTSTAITFTAATSSLDSITVTLSEDARYAGSTSSLDAANWIVDPDGVDEGGNSATDDITVTAAAFTAPRTITLTLDAADAQIGTTAKTPYVEYTGSGEIDTTGGNTLQSGASATATDGAPPAPTGAVTGTREITLTFGEAPINAPNHDRLKYSTFTRADYDANRRSSAMNLTQQHLVASAEDNEFSGDDLTYRTATSTTPAELVVPMRRDLAFVEHVVVIEYNVLTRELSDGTNALPISMDLATSYAVPVPAPPLPYTAHLTSTTTTVLTFAGPITVGGSAVTTATDIVEGEWAMYRNILDPESLPNMLRTHRFQSMAVTRAGDSPQITITHDAWDQRFRPPWPYVKHTPGSTPSLDGVSEAYVRSTTIFPTFTAEVIDGAQVLLTFDSDIMARQGNAPPSTFTHPQVAAPGPPGNIRSADSSGGEDSGFFVPYSARGHGTNAWHSTVYATSVTENLPLNQVAVTFGGEAAAGLLTSTPLVSYTLSRDTTPTYQNAAGSMYNRTYAYATDNASPVAIAEFTDADTIRVRFSEEMADPTSVLDDVAVSASGADVTIMGTPAFTAHTAATSSSAFVRPELTIDLAADAAMDTIHTVSFPGFAAAGGPTDKRAVGDATAVRGTAALGFTAATAALDSIVVTLDQSVRLAGLTGSLNPAHWIVDPDGVETPSDTADDVTVTAAAFSSRDRTVTLTLDAADPHIGSTAKTPYVGYTGSGEIETFAGTGLASGASATATDGAGPEPTGAITGLSEITLTFAEEPTMAPNHNRFRYDTYAGSDRSMNLTSSGTAADLTYTAAAGAEPAALLISTSSNLAATEHTVIIRYSTLASSRTLTDGTNTLELPHEVTALPAPLTYEARTARATSDEHYVVIEFSRAVTGTTVAGEWYTGVNEDGSGGTQATLLYRYCVEGGNGSAAPMIDVSSVCGGNTNAPIAINFSPADSASTTRVAYRAPTGDGATPIMAGTMSLPSTGVDAADGIPPLFTAATSAADTVVVTFDEPVTAVGDGAPDASRWHHYDSTAIPPAAGELAAAVTAETDFDTATLSADGLRLTLGLSSPHGGASPSRWDSANPGSTPDTIGYDVPSGGAPDLADARGNGLVGNTNTGHGDTNVADGAPPAPVGAITGLREITLTFPEASTVPPNTVSFAYGIFTRADIETRNMNLTGAFQAFELEYTAATSTAPATLVVPALNNLAEAEHVVYIEHVPDHGGPMTDGTNALRFPHRVTVPAPTEVSFRAEATALAEVVIRPNLDVNYAGATAALAAANWIVDPDGEDSGANDAADDITVMSAAFSDTDNTITLSLDALDAQIGDTSKAPYVEYAGSGELESAGGLALASGTSATARDAAPPAPTGAVTGAREITLTFGESPTADATRSGITYSVATAADASTALAQASATPPAWAAATSTDPATVTITMAADLAAVDHIVTITSTAGARIGDTGGNMLGLSHEVSVPAPVAPTFTARTVRIDANNYVRVDFTAPVTGTTRSGEWFIGVGEDGTGGTAVQTISRICATSPLPTSVINAAEVCTGDTGPRPFYLGFSPDDPSVTPRVAYRAPTGDGATPIVSATVGLALVGGPVTATDGLPPTFVAATATQRTLTVTFDEDVVASGAGAPDASRWYHYDSTTIPPSEAELADAVAAGTNFASAVLDGRTLTLTLPDSYMPSSGWGADTSAVPDTIGYSIPAMGVPDIVDTSPAANGLEHNTSDKPVDDGAPLSFTARTVRATTDTHYVRIEFTEAVTGTTVAGEWYTGVNEDGSGGTQAMTLLRYCTEGGSGLPASSIDVTAVCSGMPAPIALNFSPANSADTTRVAYRAPTGDGATPIVAGTEALPSTGVLAADGIPPQFRSVATSAADTVVVTFDEPVTAVGAGAPDASRWHHYDSTAIPPGASELADAVAAMTDFDTATLSADGLELTLGLSSPHGAASPSSWDSANPGSTPNTIGYDVPSGMAADLADAQGNAMRANTAARGVADGAPPAPVGSQTGISEITLTFPEAPATAPNNNAFIYGTFTTSDIALRSMNLTAGGAAADLEYRPATATAPAELVIPTRESLAAVEHSVLIRRSTSAGSTYLTDGTNALPSPHTVTVPVPTEVTIQAETTALDAIAIYPNVDVGYAGSTTSLDAANWIVDPDGMDTGSNDAADDITVTAAAFSDAENAITLTLDADDAQIGDTAKAPYVEYTGSGELATSGGLALASGASATARDDAPPLIAGFATRGTGAPGEDPADPADNVYTDHIDVTVTEPVAIEAGTAAQMAGHWTVLHDHDGDAGTDAVAVAVAGVALEPAGEASSRTVRLTLEGEAPLGGTTATPTVAYDASSAAAGRIILPGRAASDASLAASVAATQARDGTGPRLLALPVRGDSTPATPTMDDRDALVFSFSEDLDPATVRDPTVRPTMIVARPQLDSGSPTGYVAITRDDGSTCETGTTWLAVTYEFATDDMGAPALSDVVGSGDGAVLGTRSNTLRLEIADLAAASPQGVLWACFTKPGSNYDGWVDNDALHDTAGNPYISVEEAPHSQFVSAADDRAPGFTATVASATEVRVFYDEPVGLSDGASIDASEWRIDTTPNDDTDNADGATWITPTSISHSFGPMLRPEYWVFGEPDHLVPTDARLGIVLTVSGGMFDPDQAAPAMGAMDERPRVHYTSSTETTDVIDMYGNAAASPASAQARDSLPPVIESITVGVSTASTEANPVPSPQHARASATSPVDITFTARFDEEPDPMQAPILGILTSVTESTTVAATSGARDNARVWHMTETSATDGHTWEYTWRVANPLPGETVSRPWGSGFALAWGILVQDSDGNDLVYTQAGRYPDGSTALVTLDSEAPEARAVDMLGRPAGSDAAFTTTVGRPGSEIELSFTLNERPDRLAHVASGSGDAAVYETGLDASAVTFFSGAAATAATSLTCDDGDGAPAASLLACHRDTNGLYTYRATATLPAGQAEGLDAVEWAVSALDIYGQAGTTDSTDVGTAGHPTSLGFTVDSTAPEIVAASSHVGVDATGGTRAATDALASVAGIGADILVDITFNEAIGGTPQVEGVGTRLMISDGGTAERVAHEFHAAEAMTAVAGSGNTRWQHTYSVPTADRGTPSTVHHDSEYRIRLLMPMDTAGNTQMNCEGCGLGDVQVDNVAPSMAAPTMADDPERGFAFIHGEADARGDPIPWAAIEYTDHGGLRVDGLRAYLNTTSTDVRLAGAGHLLVKAGDIDLGGTCYAATPMCTTFGGAEEDSNTSIYFQFDYGSGTTTSPAGLTDIAGNAASWDQPDQGAHPVGGDRFDPVTEASGFRTTTADRFAGADDPLRVVADLETAAVNLGGPRGLGLGPAGETLAFDVEYGPQAAAGALLRLAAGTDASGLPASNPAMTLDLRGEAHAQRGTVYYAAIPPAGADDAAAKRSLESMGAASVAVVDRLATPAMPVLLSEPARVTLPGVPGANAAHVYWVSNTHTSDPADDRIHSIPACRASTAAAADATEVASRGPADRTAPRDPSTYSAAENAECFVRDPEADAIHVWTNHFTPFGASAEMVADAGGSGCDDCSPPTLGVNSAGARQVVGGFAYNGAVHNVDYYYTPMPLIEVETGVENVAVLKIFEDSGIDRLAHAGLAFGLGRGQHFAEAEAEIRVSIMHGGELSIALDDESGAIDAETLRVDRGVEKCMPGGEADCTVLTIYHTFMEPLEFDVVSTNVWDTRRNAWQNFYNHGVHVDGSSLNPQRGIEVNGGEMVLYPLISARVDDDGDGIYDYDERHVTYMLDGDYGVWRLTPDGTYAPLRNLRALHHEVDDSMYADGRIRTHGAERFSELFEVELARQEAIAVGIMAEMGMAVEENAMPTAEPSPYEGMSVEPRLERLSEEIAREINVAERLVASMLVAPAAGAEGVPAGP